MNVINFCTEYIIRSNKNPITPITFSEANFNPNISFHHENAGKLAGNKSYILLDNLVRFDSKSKTKKVMAQMYGIFVNTVKTANNVWTITKNGDKTLIQNEKSKIAETNKYINNMILNMNNDNKDGIYCKDFKIEYSNLDRNFHVNQSIFLRHIENCLYEFDNEFFNSHWNIREITTNFRKELKLDAVNDDFDKYQGSIGKVVILDTNLIENNNNKKQIIGFISQHDTVCATFECILARSKESKLSQL